VNNIGIDLHRADLVASVEDERGAAVGKSKRMACRDVAEIEKFFRRHIPFRAVIEASSSYRWLYDLLSPMGEVVLAHPLKLRAIVTARAKTDKLDSRLLAQLLRADLVPQAYVPPERYQELRDICRGRARLVRNMVAARNEVYAFIARANLHCPHKDMFTRGGRQWLESQKFGVGGEMAVGELLRRLEYYQAEVTRVDLGLGRIVKDYPEAEVLLGLYGVGVFTALLVIGEIGDPERFIRGEQVGAYAGLTARVHQSGGHEYSGHISKQGSPWLRWVCVQAAMKLVRRDERLKEFYGRVRRRSGAKIARVATARKFVEICWVRLRQWHRQHTRAIA
jgi:transposase